MATFISLLRGINVSGHNKIRMEDLKQLYLSLGFKKVETFIQSGNVIFSTEKPASATQLAADVRTAINREFQIDAPVIVISVEEFKKILVNPFLKEKDILPEKLHISFLSKTPEKHLAQAIVPENYLPDRYVLSEKVVFLYIPDSYGLTKLSNRFFESKLKVNATTRNWKTVNKLYEMAMEQHSAK
jgi:uncharacterized protein (DUF1697 family)